MSHPAKKDGRVKQWVGHFAHRGLHDEVSPENTKGAFEKALEADFGFECDVQLTGDGALVIHHDFDGTRSFGLEKRLDVMTLAEIKQQHVFGSQESIMTLSELLDLIQGQVPIILEIKADKDTAVVSRLVAEVLDAYDGPLVIESFHPMVLYWFRKNRPEYIRGQLAWNSFRREKATPINLLLSHYLLNFLSRPHFVAHSVEDRRSLGLQVQQKLYRTHSVVYTVKSQAQEDELGDQFDLIIFENYRPKE